MTEKEAKKIVKARNKKRALSNFKDHLCNILLYSLVLPPAALITAIFMWPLIVQALFTGITGSSPTWVNISIIVWYSLIALILLGSCLICVLNSRHQKFLKQVKEELELDEKRQELMPKIVQRLISDGYDCGGTNYSLIKTWSCDYLPEHPVMCLIKDNSTKEEFEHWLYRLDHDMEIDNE